MSELQQARDAEKAKIGFIQRLSESTMQLQRTTAQGLGAVAELAEKITDRLDELEAEVEELRQKLVVAEARFTDLKKTVDTRAGASDPKVVDLPARRA